jgi:hypothetical protein
MKMDSSDKEDSKEEKKQKISRNRRVAPMGGVALQSLDNHLSLAPLLVSKRPTQQNIGDDSRLEIPELKASPTIRISKEWIGDDFHEN